MTNTTTQLTSATQVGAWTGGSVVKVALSPNFRRDGIALAATLAGLYRSEDGGATWRLSAAGLGEPTLTTVIFAGDGAQAPPVAFAGTESGRLYRSEDLGLQWTECAAWAGLGVLTYLSAAPDFSAQPYLFAATTQGAFRSLNGGDAWESCTFGLLDDEVLCMACAPNFTQSELVWCGTGGGGFYRSRNAAKAWREAGLGLPDSALQALAVSPSYADDQTLYAGMEDGGLYHSADGGETWNIVGRATEPLPGSVNCLAITKSTGTENANGQTTRMILAGTNWGVFWSPDGGDHWEEASGGDFIALDFAADPEGMVIAGALSDGMFISRDFGKSWSPVDAPPAVHAPPLISAASPRRLFALDHDGVLAQSTDSGATWSPPTGSTARGPVEHLAIFSAACAAHDPAQPDGPLSLFIAGEDFLLRGATTGDQAAIDWTELTLPQPAGQAAPLVAISPTYHLEPALLWGHYSGDLYISTDGGDAWELTARPWVSDMTLSVTLSPQFAQDRRMVAISGHQQETGHFRMTIWQSDSAGASWTELAALETETPAVLCALPADDPQQSILLGTRNRIIRLYSPDATQEMQVHQTILGEDARITALATSPNYAQDQLVFAGVGNAIQISRDGVRTWREYTQIPDIVAIVGLLPFAPGTDLTAIALGGGVWRCPWPDA